MRSVRRCQRVNDVAALVAAERHKSTAASVRLRSCRCAVREGCSLRAPRSPLNATCRDTTDHVVRSRYTPDCQRYTDLLSPYTSDTCDCISSCIGGYAFRVSLTVAVAMAARAHANLRVGLAARGRCSESRCIRVVYNSPVSFASCDTGEWRHWT